MKNVVTRTSFFPPPGEYANVLEARAVWIYATSCKSQRVTFHLFTYC